MRYLGFLGLWGETFHLYGSMQYDGTLFSLPDLFVNFLGGKIPSRTTDQETKRKMIVRTAVS